MTYTIGRRWSRTRPSGDYPAECAFCGVLWPRSKLRRDADGKLYCPDEGDGECQGELDQGNLSGRMAAAQRSARRGRVPDGIVRPPIEVLQVAIASPVDGESYLVTDTLTVTGTCGSGVEEVGCAFAHPALERGVRELGTCTPSGGAWTLSVAMTGRAGAWSLWPYGVAGSKRVVGLPVRVVVT